MIARTFHESFYLCPLISIKKLARLTQNNYQYLVDNKMQNNTNSELRAQHNIIDRPMQKSMMQLNSRSPPNSHQQNIHFLDYNPTPLLKKSYLGSADNLASDNSSQPLSPNFSFSLRAYQQPVPREQKISQEAGSQSSALKQKWSPGLRLDVKNEGNPQELLRFGSKGGGDTLNIDKKGFNALKEQLIKEIMAYFKDQYLPSVVKIVKKEVIEEVNNLRAELHNFREETRKALKKQENELYQWSISQKALTQTPHSFTMSTANTKPEDINQLQTHFFLLEKKIDQMKHQLTLSMKQHQQQLQKFQSNLSDNRQFSKSVFKSSLPPLLLQYKQLLIVQKEFKLHQEVLSKAVYYVDRQGYLLDQDSYYLLDRKGEQIKLEEKHLKLLTFQKVLDS